MFFNIVDGNSLGFAHLYSRKDTPNGAVIGVLESIIKSLIYRSDVPYILLWDDKAHWRYELYPPYKSGRHLTPEQRDIRARYEVERNILIPLLSHLPIIQLTAKGAEADDLAFQLTRQLQSMGYLSKLFTADTDWLTAVDQLVHWINAKRPAEIITPHNFATATDFGKPEWVPVIKALDGDRSDDIVGVKGIGEKRGLALLQKYGSLENILYAASDILGWSQEPSYYQPLSNYDVQKNVLTNHQLTNLRLAPLIKPSDITMVAGEHDMLSLMSNLMDANITLDKITESMWTKYSEITMATGPKHILEEAIQQLNQAPITLV